MKKWIIRLVIAGALLVVVGLILGFVFLNSIVKSGVEKVGPTLTKTEVKLGSANISPFSGSGELKELFVGNPEGYKTASAIKMGGVKVSVQASSVLSDVVVVNSLHVQAPEITFEGGLTGNNLSKILDNLNAAGGGEATGEKAPPEQGGKKFKVKDVLVEGGKINIDITGVKSLTVPLPTLHLENIGTSDDGVTAAELSRQILKPLLASVTKAVAENVSGLGGNFKDIGKGGTEEVKKATKSLKGLFKK